MSQERRIVFKSFSSGSCGNCYYLGIEQQGCARVGVIVDAGVSVRRIRQLLAADHLSTDDFSAVLVTHDHMDHIHSLGGYWKYLRKTIWCAPALRLSLLNGRYLLEPLHPDLRNLGEGWNEIVPGLIRARWFEVPHDATHTVGYALDVDGYRIVLITDVGSMTEAALSEAAQAQTLVIEANYDDEMLSSGPYPKELQDRIRSGHGHLSNARCAQAVASVMHKGLEHVFLCHLSENNNTPALAYDAVCGVVPPEVSLATLPRTTPSELFCLNNL